MLDKVVSFFGKCDDKVEELDTTKIAIIGKPGGI